jgi:hypothetical protein
MVRYLLAWIPMLFIAVANGALREGGYGPLMSEPRAHQLSTLIGMLLFAVYIRVVVRRWRPASERQAIGVGLAWLALTVAFEFLFGHYVAGHDWSRLLADYDLLAGRLWVVLLAWIALAPYLFYRLSDPARGLRTPPPPPPGRPG